MVQCGPILLIFWVAKVWREKHGLVNNLYDSAKGSTKTYLEVHVLKLKETPFI